MGAKLSTKIIMKGKEVNTINTGTVFGAREEEGCSEQERDRAGVSVVFPVR